MSDLQQRLLAHLEILVRDRNPYLSQGHHFFTQQYIHQQLAQWGQVETHEFSVRDRTHVNLILNLPARSTDYSHHPPILIGAHYDTVPRSPGADDNASGVAALLELARLFSDQSARLPIRLVAFDMEEYGLLGSRHYATDLKRQRQKLRLMLSLEMLGYRDSTPGSQRYPPGLNWFYPDRGDFIGLLGNLAALPDLRHLTRAIRAAGAPCEWLPIPLRGWLVPNSRRSDQAPFWDQGYSGLMVTDTSYLRNPHYHKPSDRIETLDLEFLTCICAGLHQGIRTL